MSARLDPEDLREVIGTYHTAVAEEVGRFGGYVSKYMGDGVLVYFGYPEAHENDAERAVRAALSLAERMARLETHVRLETRIGIATDVVVVGDLIGAGEAQERGVVGETPNLAARMQELRRRTGSSLPRARGGCSASCSNCAISARLRSRALMHRCRSGRYCSRA
jgi:class 3 adenylate cyclase